MKAEAGAHPESEATRIAGLGSPLPTQAQLERLEALESVIAPQHQSTVLIGPDDDPEVIVAALVRDGHADPGRCVMAAVPPRQ